MNVTEFEGYCAFDTTEETAGRRMFCGEHATEPLPWFNGDNEIGNGVPTNRLCLKHYYYAEGYANGHWDASGRPEEGYDPNLMYMINEHMCFECGVPQIAKSTFTVNRADPTTAYRLICGHSTID